MANNHLAIVEMFKKPIISELWIPWYAKLHARLHLLSYNSYFSVSLSSWRNSCDIKLLEVQQLCLYSSNYYYSSWAGIDLSACRLPTWVVISCRLPVQLWKGQLCIRHQARRLSHQAPLRCFAWQHHTSPVWMRRTTRTGQSLLRRTLDHRHLFWTCWCWCG